MKVDLIQGGCAIPFSPSVGPVNKPYTEEERNGMEKAAFLAKQKRGSDIPFSPSEGPVNNPYTEEERKGMEKAALLSKQKRGTSTPDKRGFF